MGSKPKISVSTRPAAVATPTTICLLGMDVHVLMVANNYQALSIGLFFSVSLLLLTRILLLHLSKEWEEGCYLKFSAWETESQRKSDYVAWNLVAIGKVSVTREPWLQTWISGCLSLQKVLGWWPSCTHWAWSLSLVSGVFLPRDKEVDLLNRNKASLTCKEGSKTQALYIWAWSGCFFNLLGVGWRNGWAVWNTCCSDGEPSSIPSSYTGAHSHLLTLELMPFFWPPQSPGMYIVDIHMQAKQPYI